ncbi:MAG: hypothetical protein LBF89_07380 [Bacteroidales bacterium]|jgi:hypothetical protein|nr:hypothetical protein [Bacteroidales bacterium]
MKQTEIIDQIPDRIYLKIIFETQDYTWKFFALKINLTRLRLKINMFNNSDTVKIECCNELRGLLKKSVNIPNARDDLDKIFTLKDQF